MQCACDFVCNSSCNMVSAGSSAGYVSGNLPLPAADDQQSLVSSGVEEAIPLYYVHGDVTKPQREEGDHSKCQLILHCVDNSGTFGSRGIFAALRAKDPSIADRYELISHMGDMKMGDAHLINDVKDMRGPPGDEQQPSTSADVSEAVVLFVAQSSKHRDEIRPTILEQCFTRIGEYARHCDASVHMARIGYGTSLSWYTVERLIKKCISDHGVPTYIYYFARQHRPQPPSPPPQSPRAPTKRPKPALRGPSKRPKVEKTSGDFVVDDEDEEEDEESSSSSASSSASENDWSEDDGEEEEEEDTSDEGSSADEEIDDEELEELKIRRRSRRQPLRDVRSRYSDRKRMISNNSNSESSEEANVSESDTEGYHTPQHLPPFTDMAVSLYGMDKNVAEKLTDIIVENEGYVITDKSELKDATHAVVDPETAGDSEKFEEFKKLFDVDCVFVEENWISDCVEARKKLDALLNEP
ncbi:hypothetical protein Y032_0009g826 [Ancylostoma ceylanicum]|uniref:BRCT domain-containing protein n=2 Tax=Ancylostoma ceylanicum TaxID=53326 RepID=A0A016VJN9_9BILA|nr:hypothetical protein Y032_0009g826 [Ancylostoma ceylanicum]